MYLFKQLLKYIQSVSKSEANAFGIVKGKSNAQFSVTFNQTVGLTTAK